jgi:nucleotide-binding universal stress UspA family protein
MPEQASHGALAGVLAKSEAHSLELGTILAATDLSANSQVAVQYACSLAKLTQGTVILLHVFELPALASRTDIYFSSGDTTFELEAAQRAVLEKLHNLRDGMVSPQVPCASSMPIGTPYEEIVDEAEKRRADLVVVGTQGRSGIGRFLMGSTAERVCRHAACSVLVVRHEPVSHEPDSAAAMTPELKLGKILVPTDLSENSFIAINYAAGLARLTGAHLTLFHVFQIPDYATSPNISLSCRVAQPDIAAAQCRALDRLQSLREVVTASGVNADAGMRTGVPYQEIIGEAEKVAPDLIVVGTQGATGLARYLLGSTAERVLRHSSCPVLVARATSTGPDQAQGELS